MDVVDLFCFRRKRRRTNPPISAGEWVVGPTEQKCDSTEFEHLTFRKNGSFEGGRTGKVEAAGIWSIDEDIVSLHIVSSPAFFEDIHEELKAFKDQYHYFYIKIVPFNIEDGKFEAVGVIGEMIKKGVFVRCK